MRTGDSRAQGWIQPALNMQRSDFVDEESRAPRVKPPRGDFPAAEDFRGRCFTGQSVSEATRRAYGRAVREFFQSVGTKHPSEVVPNDISAYEDEK
jgi:hypothetical protein